MSIGGLQHVSAAKHPTCISRDIIAADLVGGQEQARRELALQLSESESH
jgi:hypothetical protein